MAETEISKKQQIMEAAARLFRDRGYSATSMRDLAKAVHLQAPSLYNHISGKQEILKEICFQNARRFAAGLERIESDYSEPEDRVRALIEFHLEVATSDATSITSFNDEWRHLEAAELEAFRQQRKSYERRFRSIIEQGMQQGIFRTADPAIVLYTILSSIRWVYDWYQPERATEIEQVKAEVIGFVMAGLLEK